MQKEKLEMTKFPARRRSGGRDRKFVARRRRAKLAGKKFPPLKPLHFLPARYLGESLKIWL